MSSETPRLGPGRLHNYSSKRFRRGVQIDVAGSYLTAQDGMLLLPATSECSSILKPGLMHSEPVFPLAVSEDGTKSTFMMPPMVGDRSSGTFLPCFCETPWCDRGLLARYGQEVHLHIKGPPETYSDRQNYYCKNDGTAEMLDHITDEAQCKEECSKRPECKIVEMKRGGYCWLVSQECESPIPSPDSYILNRKPCRLYSLPEDCPWSCFWDGSECHRQCSKVDGSGLSFEYPCMCGSARCLESQYCIASSSSCIDKSWWMLPDSERKQKYVSGGTVGDQVVIMPATSSRVMIMNMTLNTPAGMWQTHYLPDYKDPAPVDKYISSAVVGTKVVAVPHETKDILIVDTADYKSTVLPVYSELNKTGSMSYNTIVVVDGLVIAAPYDGEHVLEINPADNSWRMLPGYADASPVKYASSVVVGDRVIAVPDYSAKILVVSTINSKVFTFPGYSDSAAAKYRTSVVIGSKVIALPYTGAKEILEIDSSTNTWRMFPGYSDASPRKYYTSQAIGTKVVGVPYSANYILIVNLADDTVLRLPGYNDPTGMKYRTSEAILGKVIALPLNAKKVLVVDAATNSWSYVLGYSNPAALAYEASIAVGTMVVGMPYDATDVLVVNATTSND
eukprot:TRINITY_DN10238_c1_g1_i3.p1 TRINITY_DN10238_c1_g1~~TRINITY_DN10238_c1_g1_i3.p1  ORF type:complete len:631 (-),score=59.73 TRINITY_DN10238_c1_g1_i3:339-2198(-)